MNTVNNVTNTVAKTMGKSANRLLKHKHLNLVVVLLLALYAGMAAPALPNVVVKAVDTTVGKLIFLFLIAFVASRNIQVALMVAVAFVVTLHIANRRTAESYINSLERFKAEANATQEEPECDACSKEAEALAASDEAAALETCKNEQCPATYVNATDNTASRFSNFEGFWAGATGADSSDSPTGADSSDSPTGAIPAPEIEEETDTDTEGDNLDATTTTTGPFTNFEGFSVYPDSGARYSYSLF